MTPLTTAAAATRVIRSESESPPGSQLELAESCILAHDLSVDPSCSFRTPSRMRRCHHRRNRPRSASVTRSPATAPRRASSASSSDTDARAGAADDGDYEPKERSAGTPRRRSGSATSSSSLEGDLASRLKLGVGSLCYPLSAAARHRPRSPISSCRGSGVTVTHRVL
jgi:hypothetical protein